jgi:hypothetical protein
MVVNCLHNQEDHVQDKVETQSGTYRERLLDRDRIASMADEGGMSAAEMDLIEQFPAAPLAVRRRDRGWPVGILVGALVMGVAAVITRFLIGGRKQPLFGGGRKRPRARRFKLR